MFPNVTLLFFLLLIPLSGFIAWAGDRIGHKSGKRRHSLFGLRPRHTAMVFTVGTGMCISLVSFALFWLMSESFRIVMSQGGALIEKNRSLRLENSGLAVSNSSLKREVQESQHQAQISGAEAQKADARRDIAVRGARTAFAQAKRAQEAVLSAQQKLADETQKLQNAENTLRQEKASLAKVKSELAVRSRRVQLVEEQLTQAERQFRLAQNQVTATETRAAAAEGRARDADSQATRVKQTAADAIAFQKKTLDGLREQLAEQNKLYAEQKGRTEQQQNALTVLTRQVDDERHQLEQLRTNTNALRQKQITYQIGEEVDRLPIRSGYSIWRIEAILESLLTAASKKAEARGARRGGEARSVLLLPRPLTPRDGGDVQLVSEEDQVRAAAAAIRTANTDVVVIARAATNAVTGEPVPVDLKPYRNPLVFNADTKIGEVGIDGTAARQEIADRLSNFLHQDVRHILLQAGVIPPTRGGSAVDDGGDATTTAAPVPGGEEVYGSIINLSGEDWLQIIDRIRMAGSRARVVVLAAKSMRAGDPVALRFEVKGTPVSALLHPGW